MDWQKQKRAARRKAENLHHRMKYFQKLSHCLWVSHCLNGCGAQLMVGGNPNISGEAVEVECSNPAMVEVSSLLRAKE